MASACITASQLIDFPRGGVTVEDERSGMDSFSTTAEEDIPDAIVINFLQPPSEHLVILHF
jgi:hypothetical protein